MNAQEIAIELGKLHESSTAEETLKQLVEKFGSKIAFASSLGAEDQVITHMLAAIDKNVKIFTLDTGRLFPETYQLIDKTNTTYGINIEVYFPDYKQVEEMVAQKGINLFYDSIENRKECCYIRKVVPLKRAFSTLDAWICGLRREQSITRFGNKRVEWDEANELIKVNPLIDWSEEDVWEYIKKHAIPYNELHDEGYPSIGCQPCTRAVKPGEDVRAGRWWWEQPEKRECGLHNRPVK
ncbi:MAG: phosphoadenylyl-sulfate reductase [Bacteroidales bacterium]